MAAASMKVETLLPEAKEEQNWEIENLQFAMNPSIFGQTQQTTHQWRAVEKRSRTSVVSHRTHLCGLKKQKDEKWRRIW